MVRAAVMWLVSWRGLNGGAGYGVGNSFCGGVVVCG